MIVPFFILKKLYKNVEKVLSLSLIYGILYIDKERKKELKL